MATVEALLCGRPGEVTKGSAVSTLLPGALTLELSAASRQSRALQTVGCEERPGPWKDPETP